MCPGGFWSVRISLNMLCKEKNRECANAQIATVLISVSSELSMLAVTSHRLQGPIGDVLKNSDAALPETVYDLQNLDRLTQMIEALADFMNQLSLQTQPDWFVDVEHAAKSLTLASLAARLSAPEDEAEQDAQGADTSGECVYL
jgi:hypothetical protein